jgi:hypothetical protein
MGQKVGPSVSGTTRSKKVVVGAEGEGEMKEQEPKTGLHNGFGSEPRC